MNNHKSYEVIGYSYDADLHCIKCAEKRFPDGYKNKYSDQKRLSLIGLDHEGNKIHPIFLGDESALEPFTPVCGDCFELLE